MDAVRVAVLVCCCLLTFGSYFSYDLPGSLPDDFRESLAQNNTAHQGLFYSMYSLPNTVQPFFGGLVIDKFLGLRRGAAICCAMVAIGCTVVAAAASKPSWQGTSEAFALALLGRFIFGLGGETLSVCQNAFCARWFRGADLATAFAIVLSFARVGSAVNFAIEPNVRDAYGFASALWLSSALCAVSFGACLMLGFLDLKFESLVEVEGSEACSEDAEVGATGASARQDDGNHDGLQSSLLEDDRLAAARPRTNSEGAAQSRRAAGLEQTDPPTLSTADAPPGRSSAARHSSTWEILLSVIGPREVLIYLICVQFYIAVFIFIAVASKFLVDTYEVDKIQAGLLTSLPYTVSAIVSPFLGLTMDKVGRSGVFVCIACASLCGVHMTFAFAPHSMSPTTVMVWLGLTYSMCAASLWPMIALVVESRNISTAYGLMMSIQNVGLAAAPAIIMPMVPASRAHIGNYKTIEAIFAVLAFGALVCTAVLYVVDARLGGVLFARPAEAALVIGRTPRVNPLNPRASPFVRQSVVFRPTEALAQTAIAPKTPQAIRQQYFRRLRIQSRV